MDYLKKRPVEREKKKHIGNIFFTIEGGDRLKKQQLFWLFFHFFDFFTVQ